LSAVCINAFRARFWNRFVTKSLQARSSVWDAVARWSPRSPPGKVGAALRIDSGKWFLPPLSRRVTGRGGASRALIRITTGLLVNRRPKIRRPPTASGSVSKSFSCGERRSGRLRSVQTLTFDGIRSADGGRTNDHASGVLTTLFNVRNRHIGRMLWLRFQAPDPLLFCNTHSFFVPIAVSESLGPISVSGSSARERGRERIRRPHDNGSQSRFPG
jgi:hypothetical protein